MTSRPGFILIAALWLLTLVAIASATISAKLRNERISVLALADATRSQNAALAGIAHADALLTAMHENSLAVPGGALVDMWRNAPGDIPDTAISLGYASYRLRTRLTGSMLNINLLTPAEILRFLNETGISSPQADSLAAAIADWIDTDDIPLPLGIERSGYTSVAMPPNRHVVRVHELQQVRGLSADVFATIAPYLVTVGSGRVHVGIAPRPVIASLPGMSEEAVDNLIRMRSEGKFSEIGGIIDGLSTDARRTLEGALPALTARTTFATNEIIITSEGISGAHSVHIEALFVASGRGPQIVSWHTF